MDLFLSCSPSLCISLIVLLTFCRGISGAKFMVINRCDYTVWPGILANAGSASLGSTGFELGQGASRSFQAPSSWSGRFWGRTGCTFDQNTGQGSCVTADCGSNQVECNGAGANPPATLAEFTIGSNTNQDFYDVSLVDGYNVPMVVDPSSGSGTCLSTGCVADLNRQCPNELRVGDGAACKSACEAFGTPEYCCSGAYSSPDTCKPSVYSEMFKAACPRSYSYAYDDATSTFTCSGADYTITFCPSQAREICVTIFNFLSCRKKSARDTSPTTTNTTTTSSSGSQPQEMPQVVDSPWLSNFFTGDSSKTFSRSNSAIACVTSLLSLLLLYP